MKAKTLYGPIWNIFIALICKIQSTEKNCLSRHKRSGDCVVQLTSAISLSCLRWFQLCQITRILLQQLLEDNTVCPQLAQTPSEYSHPIRPPAAAWNVDTRRQNPRFRVALCQKILTQPSDRQSWNQDSSDEATFSQSPCSLTQLTGEAPSLVLLLQPFCHPLQRCNQWSNESFLHFRYHLFRDFPSVNPRGGCTRKSHWIGSLAPPTVSRSRSLEWA